MVAAIHGKRFASGKQLLYDGYIIISIIDSVHFALQMECLPSVPLLWIYRSMKVSWRSHALGCVSCLFGSVPELERNDYAKCLFHNPPSCQIVNLIPVTYQNINFPLLERQVYRVFTAPSSSRGTDKFVTNPTTTHPPHLH